MLLQRFEEAIQALKEGLRRNEDVPYGLNALGASITYIHIIIYIHNMISNLLSLSEAMPTSTWA